MRRRIAMVVGGALALWGLSVASVATGLFDRARVETAATTSTTGTTATSTTTTAAAPPAAGETTTSLPGPAPATGGGGAAAPARMAPASTGANPLAAVRDEPAPSRRTAALAAPPGAPPVQGRIIIPRLGLDTVTYEGYELAQIDYGPSHITGTAQPGHVGNTVFAGHRVTKTHPFRYLDRLQPGDTVTFVMRDGTYTYRYEYTSVVDETQVEILEQGSGHTATIFACHPPGSDRYRIVTHWRLVSDAATDAPTPDPNGPDPSKAPGFGTGRGGGSGSLGGSGSSSPATTTPTTSPPAGGGGGGGTTAPTIGRLPGR